MQGTLRKLFWSVPVLVPLVCLCVMGWKAQADANQARRNQALLAAVRADRPAEVMAALRQGADANARDLPLDTRTLWQRLWTLFRPVPIVTADSLSALHIAVQREFDPDNGEPPEANFAIIKALHDAGATAEGDAPQYQAFLDAQEQAIRQSLAKPPVTPDAAALLPAEMPLVDHLKQRGMSGRAFAAIGRYRLYSDSYAEAISDLTIAHLWLPEEKEIAAELAQAQEWNSAWERLNREISRSRHVSSLCRFPDEQGRTLWAALWNREEDGYRVAALCLDIYQAQDGGFRRLATTGLRAIPPPDDVSRDAWEEAGRLQVLHLTGRRLPEIVVSTEDCEFGAGQSVLTLYEWRRNRLRCVFDRSSDEAFQIVDFGNKGQAEIVDDWETGGAIPRALRPGRANVYAFRKGKFAAANAEFPAAFEPIIAEETESLRSCPDDFHLQHRLAYLCSITGKERKAEGLYRRAERRCRHTLWKTKEADFRAGYRTELKQIESRDAGWRG